MRFKIFFFGVLFFIILFLLAIPLVQASLVENFWYKTLDYLGFIEITKANHLNLDRIIVSDIFREVKELDGIWTELIDSDEYIRVTFERNLTAQNDISIYPRVVSGTPKIEIYEKDSDVKIGEFSFINSNQYNKVFLTNLIKEQSTFDLKILGGGIEFDHIIDPTYILLNVTSVNVTICGEVNNYTNIVVGSTGILSICNFNGSVFTGYANITLGKYGNFTVFAGGVVNGTAGGSTGGAGTTSNTANSTQGTDGNTSTVGSALAAANGGGGGGSWRSSASYGAGGAGGGFGGAGGLGSYDNTRGGRGVAGLIYLSSSTLNNLRMGSGGAGGASDSPTVTVGGAGGAGIMVNASSGTIYIAGTINMGALGGQSSGTGDCGGGGGGSGGHIILNARNITLNNGVLNVTGGNGGNCTDVSDQCGGGGGAGGRIILVYSTFTNTTGNIYLKGGWAGRTASCDNVPGNGNVGSQNYTVFSFEAPDLTNPTLTIDTPANNTNTTDNLIDINYTIVEANKDACWYSNDTFAINNTLANCGNITTVIWVDGQHNVKVWANDTYGNENSTSVSFYIDRTPPYFLHLLSNFELEAGQSFNYDVNATDDWIGLQAYAVNDTRFSANSSGAIWNSSELPIALYYINISINDTFGNLNSSVFYVNVTQGDSCSCPGTNANWEIDMADNCVINSNCSLGVGNITFTDAMGNATFNATISCKNLEYPIINQILKIGYNARIFVG